MAGFDGDAAKTAFETMFTTVIARAIQMRVFRRSLRMPQKTVPTKPTAYAAVGILYRISVKTCNFMFFPFFAEDSHIDLLNSVGA